MPRIFFLSVLAIAVSVFASADSSSNARRDKALDGINACLRRNEVSSRECKHLNQNVQTLVEVYRSGDKSVLPTLFRFTYLTDFYDEALLSDPDYFLSTMAHLPAKNQEAVSAGIAGGKPFGILTVDKFKAIRDLLANVPEASPTKQVAELSLKAVVTTNASLFTEYFPPQTFTSRTANFQVALYSSEMYKLGEEPLWPPSLDSKKTYRLTYMGAFTRLKAVTLTVLPGGGGQIKLSILHNSPDQLKDNQPLTVTQDRVSDFLYRLEQTHFLDMATESQHWGNDGAVWMMEGVQDGRYHIAVRWCPNVSEHSPESAAFADAARFLFELAGHKHQGSC